VLKSEDMMEHMIPDTQLRRAIQGEVSLPEKDLALELLMMRSALDVALLSLTQDQWREAQAEYQRRCQAGI
jgi:hypothetical protein